MKIFKQDIVKAIYKKFGGELKYELIEDVIFVICSYIEEQLIANMAISIKNFGTLSPYLFHGHKAIDVQTGAMTEIAPFRLVMLRPSLAFKRMIKGRLANLSNSEVGKNS